MPDMCQHKFENKNLGEEGATLTNTVLTDSQSFIYAHTYQAFLTLLRSTGVIQEL